MSIARKNFSFFGKYLPLFNNRECNEENQCVCKGDFAGANCLQEKCPGGCGAGYCNNKTSLCECTEGYTGANCSQRALGHLEGMTAFNKD